jgi:hypothetical protein
MAKQDNKLFTVAGTATNPDGTTKVRFANDLVARVKILTKAGCTNIELVELPEPMTKLAALEYLQEQRKSGDEGYVIANKLAEKSKVAKKGEMKVTLSTGGKSKAKTKAQRAVEIGLADSVEEARAVVGDAPL